MKFHILNYISFDIDNIMKSLIQSKKLDGSKIMVKLIRKQKLDKYLSVAVTAELRDAMNTKADELGLTSSEIIRQLVEKFLAGDFDSIEDLRPRRKTRTQRKDKVLA